MMSQSRTTTIGTAVAAALALSAVPVSTAGAAMMHKHMKMHHAHMHHHMRMAKKPMLAPAQQKASYRGVSGSMPSMLIDMTNGGVLGSGFSPTGGAFAGLPIIGQLGL